jgi:hypothetical protein
MCDYSLYAIPNRLAEDGECVVLHRFGTGTIGFASVLDIPPTKIEALSGWAAFRAAMKTLLSPRSCPCVTAVCMPPGTRLMITDMPVAAKRVGRVRLGDTVTVTEITSESYSYRDALILSNGKCVLLQDLPEGLQAVVLSTASELADMPLEEIYVR